MYTVYESKFDWFFKMTWLKKTWPSVLLTPVFLPTQLQHQQKCLHPQWPQHFCCWSKKSVLYFLMHAGSLSGSVGWIRIYLSHEWISFIVTGLWFILNWAHVSYSNDNDEKPGPGRCPNAVWQKNAFYVRTWERMTRLFRVLKSALSSMRRSDKSLSPYYSLYFFCHTAAIKDFFFSFFENTEKKNNSCSLQHWKLILNSGLFQCLEGFYMSTETELASFIFPLISNHSHLLMSSVSSCWTTYTHIWKVPVSKLPTHI